MILIFHVLQKRIETLLFQMKICLLRVLIKGKKEIVTAFVVE